MALSAVPRLLFWAFVAFLFTVTNQFLGRIAPLPAPGSLAASALALAYLGGLLFVLMRLAQSAAHLGRVSTPFLLIVGLLLAAPLATALLLARQKLFPPLWLYLSANNLFLPVAAALAGAAIGRIIRHPNTLLAGAGFAVFFDIVVVTMGTVAVFLKRNPALIAAVSVGGGLPAAPGQPTRIIPALSYVTIGPADVLFLALFFGAVVLLKLEEKATFAAAFALLFASLAAVQLREGLAIPALAPMGIAVILANGRHAAFTRAEKYALLYGGAFALVLAAVMIVGASGLIGER